jgi:hypothetical protein
VIFFGSMLCIASKIVGRERVNTVEATVNETSELYGMLSCKETSFAESSRLVSYTFDTNAEPMPARQSRENCVWQNVLVSMQSRPGQGDVRILVNLPRERRIFCRARCSRSEPWKYVARIDVISSLHRSFAERKPRVLERAFANVVLGFSRSSDGFTKTGFPHVEGLMKDEDWR